MNCVVTGGTEGIGKSIIYRFAKQGFDIITCARNQTKLDLLKVDIERKYAVKVFILAVDVSIKEEVLNFGQFINDLGIPEILIKFISFYYLPAICQLNNTFSSIKKHLMLKYNLDDEKQSLHY